MVAGSSPNSWVKWTKYRISARNIRANFQNAWPLCHSRVFWRKLGHQRQLVFRFLLIHRNKTALSAPREVFPFCFLLDGVHIHVLFNSLSSLLNPWWHSQEYCVLSDDGSLSLVIILHATPRSSIPLSISGGPISEAPQTQPTVNQTYSRMSHCGSAS